jgi:hypothetical protein
LSFFRSIIATLLTVLIASPLCCCSAKAAGTEARSSCCASTQDGDKEGQAPHVCACRAKEPRDSGETFQLPGDIAVPLPLTVENLSHLSPPVPVTTPRALTPHTGCDPPRWRLTHYSRWLL